MQRVSVICVGKLKERFYIEAAGEYGKRLSRFCALDIRELPERATLLEEASDILRAAKGHVVALAVDIKPLRYISYFLYLYAFMGFIYSQVNYIANVFVAIDGNTFTAGFIATAVCLVLAFGIMLAAAITTNVAPWKKGGAAPAEAEEEVMRDD